MTMQIHFNEPWKNGMNITYQDLCEKFENLKAVRRSWDTAMRLTIQELATEFERSLGGPLPPVKKFISHNPAGNPKYLEIPRVRVTLQNEPVDPLAKVTVDEQQKPSVTFIISLSFGDKGNGEAEATVESRGTIYRGQGGYSIYMYDESFYLVDDLIIDRYTEVCDFFKVRLYELLTRNAI